MVTEYWKLVDLGVRFVEHCDLEVKSKLKVRVSRKSLHEK